MTTFQTVLYEKQRNGVLITLNRPETLNAISRDLEHDIAAALTEAEADPEVRLRHGWGPRRDPYGRTG